MSYQHEDKPAERSSEAQGGFDGPSVKLILALLVLAAIVVFIIANDDPTTVSFGVFDWDTTVRWSIFIAVVLGIVLDRLVMWSLGRRREAKRKKKD